MIFLPAFFVCLIVKTFASYCCFYARFVLVLLLFVLFRVIISIWCCFSSQDDGRVSCGIPPWSSQAVRSTVGWLFFLFNLILSSRVVWMRKKTFAAAAAAACLHCLQITVKDFHLTLYGLFSVERIWMEIGWRGTGTVAGPKMRVHVPRTKMCVNHKNFNRDVYIYRRVLFCHMFFLFALFDLLPLISDSFAFCLNSSY